MQDYKDETKRTYDTYSSLFDEKFGQHFNDSVVRARADEFIASLEGRKIVDLGCGTGNHSEYFASKGLDVLCVDISDKMLDICKQKGLRTMRADLENLVLPEQYDGIWAYASLLHLRKDDFPSVMSRIASYLKPGGLLGLALKEGDGERYETNHKYPGTQRWFSYYQAEEVLDAAGGDFDVLASLKSPFKSFVFLHFLFRKKIT